jgi:hypothetical protein
MSWPARRDAPCRQDLRPNSSRPSTGPMALPRDRARTENPDGGGTWACRIRSQEPTGSHEGCRGRPSWISPGERCSRPTLPPTCLRLLEGRAGNPPAPRVSGPRLGAHQPRSVRLRRLVYVRLRAERHTPMPPAGLPAQWRRRANRAELRQGKSSPTTPRSCVSSPQSSPKRTTNGRSATVATSPKPP